MPDLKFNMLSQPLAKQEVTQLACSTPHMLTYAHWKFDEKPFTFLSRKSDFMAIKWIHVKSFNHNLYLSYSQLKDHV